MLNTCVRSNRSPRCWLALCLLACLASSVGEAADPPARGRDMLYIRADRRDLDYRRGIGIVVGNVRFMAPNSNQLVTADAGVVWLREQEAYFEGNIRIHTTLGGIVRPSDFFVPKPNLTDRTGLEPGESIEEAGDLDDLIGVSNNDQSEKPDEEGAILIDTRVPVSEAERIYINWATETAYVVKPVFRFSRAEQDFNWTVTAPSAEGIATYLVPVRDKDGKFTGKYERRRHYAIKNPTFTACTFKEPHTSVTATHAEYIDGDYMTMHNVLLNAGDIPIFYLPYVLADLEYEWPWVRFAFGSSSRLGTFGSVKARFEAASGVRISPRVEYFSKRGLALGLEADYEFGHDAEIRGALNVFWVPKDKGEDDLADTSREKSGWPEVWTPAVAAVLGPLPSDLPLEEDRRYRIHFVHQQEYPKGVEFDLEIHKFSDAGVYREYFEKEFKTAKPPETRALLKYGRDNWAAFVHVKTRINDFLDETEYMPQIGFNVIAQPIGAGFLFSSDTELARVRARFANTRARAGMSDVDMIRKQLRENEYSLPAALTLRENDTDGLWSWRFDTINIISRPFEIGVFDIEPYIGWRGTWYQHGIHPTRGSYADAVAPVPPAGPIPPEVAALPTSTGSRFRNQFLAGARVATQFHRTYDVSDRPALRGLFPYGQRHIITPEITWVYESPPNVKPKHLPQHDAVTEEIGLHRINFALRNRWQTRWAPEIQRDPRAPLGGEWYRRKLAAKLAEESEPVDVIDWDVDIDYFVNPSRDNVHPRGRRVRRFSNLRSDLAFRPSKNLSFFFDTELALEGMELEVLSAGVGYRPSPDLEISLSHSYHFHDESVLRLAVDWEVNPKWHVRFDVQQDFSGGGAWDRLIEITRRFHEWEITLGFEHDRGKKENVGIVHIAPTRTQAYRPSWRFQPRSIRAYELVESAR